MTVEATRPRLVVAGVDGSDHSPAVLRWAADYARSVRGRLRVVLAWQLPQLPGHVPFRVESEWSEAAEKLVDRLVFDAADGVEFETVVQEGGAVRVLLHEARDADLLVLGSHGHGHEGGKLLGSVVHSCLMQAPCPVVVVPVDGQGRG